MPRRTAIALAYVLACAAIARGGDAPRWQTTVQSSRPELPPVSVIMGYPGPYVPASNAPIDLIVHDAPATFDGYVGFRFAVGTARTDDTPVIARAALKKGEPWAFSTTAHLDWYSDRQPRLELLIEWLDRSFAVLATERAGIPPWSERRRLRIVGGDSATLDRYDGKEPVVISSTALATQAQWYSGFSGIVVPVDAWLDLPRSFRQTIFHSGTRIEFFGGPRAGQTTADIDDAVLPVRFSTAAGVVEIPFVYRRDGKRTRPTSYSWTAKPGATILGAPSCPYLTMTRLATYAADESALQGELPQLNGTILVNHDLKLVRSGIVRGTLASLRGILRRQRAAIVLLAAVLMSLLVWLRVRRSADLRILSVSVAAAAVILSTRGWMRPGAGSQIEERWVSIAPRVAMHLWFENAYGPSPLPQSQVDPSIAMTCIASEEQVWGQPEQVAEIRTSDTPPAHGEALFRQELGSVARIRRRLELGTPAADVHVLNANADMLTIEYAVPFDPAEAIAWWTWNGTIRAAHLRPNKAAGQVTFRWFDLYTDDRPLIPWVVERWGNAEGVRVRFYSENSSHRKVVEWQGRVPIAGRLVPLQLSPPLTMNGDGNLVATFKLPAAALLERSIVSIELPYSLRHERISFVGEGGTLVAKRVRTELIAAGDELVPISNPHGLIQLVVTSPKAKAADMTINVKEKP